MSKPIRTPEEILRDLVVDLTAMRHNGGVEGADPQHCFGPFNWDCNDGADAVIEWPCIAILLDEAKEALEHPERPPVATTLAAGTSMNPPQPIPIPIKYLFNPPVE